MSQEPRDTPHEAWEDRMIEVLDGRADLARRAELDAHLATCLECRALFDEYATLFVRLGQTFEEEPAPAGFWDALAADIERRVRDDTVAAGTPAGGSAAPMPCGAVEEPTTGTKAASGSGRRQVIDLSERPRLNGGWNGLAGGLVAAGIAVLLLVGLYLELPRQAGQPQAFVTPPSRREGTTGPAEPAAPAMLARRGEPAPVRSGTAAGAAPPETASAPGMEDAGAAELLALSPELDAEDEGAAAVSALDPLAALADPEAALQDLTPEEAEQLLRDLEELT
jgi:hypothetical protein